MTLSQYNQVMKSTLFKLIFLVILITASLGLYYQNNQKSVSNSAKTILQPSITKSMPAPNTKRIPSFTIRQTSVFVPYWTLDEGLAHVTANTLIYFGITPNEDGLMNRKEPGYMSLDRFRMLKGSKPALLTLRMIDDDINDAILNNTQKQQRVVNQTITLAKQQGFRGIVLDLELSSLAIGDVEKQVSEFVQVFGRQARAEKLHFAVATYGDTFFRARPFHLPTIAKAADEVIIMTYDFSKSYGEPGPTFPFADPDQLYHYSFQQMIEDYLQVVPANKITIAFGYFGYNWPIGNQGIPLTSATAVTLNQATRNFMNGCPKTNCKVIIHPTTKEANVKYQEDTTWHEVWFETLDSIEVKRQYMLQQGISSESGWAYGFY